VSRSDGFDDEGQYALSLALFPNADFEFGISAARQQLDGGIEQDSIAGFASWFVRNNVELGARYQQNDQNDSFIVDYDSSEFGLGFNVRF
jgi:hypothetical protein